MNKIRQEDSTFSQISVEKLSELTALYNNARGPAKYKAAALMVYANEVGYWEYTLPGSTQALQAGESSQNPLEASWKDKGVEKTEHINRLTVYPNPSKGTFYFSSPANATHLEIKDLAGRLVMSKTIAGKDFQWNAAAFDQGIYFYSIYSDGAKLASGKLILNK